MRRCSFLLLLACLFGLSSSAIAQCNLSCQSADINVAISETGLSPITPDIFVVGMTGTCTGTFTVQLFNNLGTDLGNTVDCTMLNLTLTARYTHDNSGNFCESTLIISDNIAPVVTCSDVTINCSDSTAPNEIGAVTVTDNCDSNPSLTYSESIQNQLCSNTGFNRIITRTYTATDASGNISGTCQQQIFVRAANLADVIFPMNYDDIELPALDCSASYPSSALTGMPTLLGNPLQDVCKISIDSSDQILNICENSYKILRTWTALNCCTGATSTDIQIIKIADNAGPTVTCPTAPIMVGTDSGLCAADVTLPTLTVSDNCSTSINTQIFSTFGTFTTNGTTVNNVPAGTHDFNYRFTDNCGNESFCLVTIEVADDDSPTLICEQFIDISIGSSGVGIIDAIDLDENSFDNCCSDLSFAVKRQDEADSEYGAQESFTCADLGIQTLTLQVTDCNGFANTCMIQVEVEDKTAPLIVCPSDITLACTEVNTPVTPTGNPTVFDNCGATNVVSADTPNLNSCDVGTITRVFTVTDAQNLNATCSQTITYEDTTPLTVNFPPDISINTCDGNIDTAITGAPTTNADCELVGFNITDLPLMTNNPCEIKIERTHQVMDLCSGTMFSDAQIIVITDSDPPVFDQAPGALNITVPCGQSYDLPDPPTATDACSDVTITLANDSSATGSCPQNSIRTLTYQAEDACGNTALYPVSISIVDQTGPVFTTCPSSINTFAGSGCQRLIDFLDVAVAVDACGGNVTYSNDSPFAFAGNADVTGNYPIGTTDITITATDACGNSNNCLFNITITDSDFPVVNCIGNTTMINLTTDTFVVIPPSFFEISTTDCSAYTLELSQDTFSCEDIARGDFAVNLIATDVTGKTGTCPNAVFVCDPNDVCGFGEPPCANRIAGTIRYREAQPFPNISVTAENAFGTIASTSSELGVYSFNPAFPEEACTIRPFHNENPTAGVTSWDLILIVRHVLQIEPLSDPYAILAADVNGSGTITMADILEIKRVILGMQDNFQNMPAWRFVPENYVFPNPENPYEGGFPPDFLDVNPAWEELDLNFIAIKLGDVNNSVE